MFRGRGAHYVRMKHYALTFLTSPELSEQELNSLQEKIISFLHQEGGVLGEKSRPIRKQLPSPIQKKAQAFLWSFDFSLEPTLLESLKQKLSAENQILRYTLLGAKPRSAFKKVPREETFALRKKEEKGKVEISQIEKKLEEILGE
ncbi:MAG: 30S ribosomal protein S6 [Parcubacteria group bacterium Gr01-1014_30]|nr:MAG: 30S ribosomal protein S6 [Parcubacteria group bacterium Gr01-1014_30]